MKEKHIHIVGICGVATSALAIAFHKAGWKVTGSDKGFFPPVSTALQNVGISFYAGWHPENIAAPQLVIAGGSGTSLANPEVVYAKEKGIPVLSFAEAVGKYFVRKNSVVIAGTWGKTTASALLSFILKHAGKNPTYMTGGISLSHDAASLTESDWSVLEGDEYQAAIWDKKPKFSYYKPTHLLLTAVSWDHADLYPTEASYFEAFRGLVSSSGFIVACKDNAGVREAVGGKHAVWYGTSDADYVYGSVRQTKEGLAFLINGTRIVSPMIGTFQAENITGCYAIARELGIEETLIVEAISAFQGLKRRLEKRHGGSVTVIDDIAHSPEKAASVLRELRSICGGRIIAVFEPNSGARRKEILSKYAGAFKDADEVIIPRLTKIKTSGEAPLEGNELAEVIGSTHKSARYISEDDELVRYIVQTAQKGDTIVFLGSHGFRGMIEETIKRLS